MFMEYDNNRNWIESHIQSFVIFYKQFADHYLNVEIIFDAEELIEDHSAKIAENPKYSKNQFLVTASLNKVPYMIRSEQDNPKWYIFADKKNWNCVYGKEYTCSFSIELKDLVKDLNQFDLDGTNYLWIKIFDMQSINNDDNILENTGVSEKSRKLGIRYKNGIGNNCPFGCNGNGKCLETTCSCNKEYIGSDCSVKSQIIQYDKEFTVNLVKDEPKFFKISHKDYIEKYNDVDIYSYYKIAMTIDLDSPISVNMNRNPFILFNNLFSASEEIPSPYEYLFFTEIYNYENRQMIIPPSSKKFKHLSDYDDLYYTFGIFLPDGIQASNITYYLRNESLAGDEPSESQTKKLDLDAQYKLYNNSPIMNLSTLKCVMIIICSFQIGFFMVCLSIILNTKWFKICCYKKIAFNGKKISKKSQKKNKETSDKILKNHAKFVYFNSAGAEEEYEKVCMICQVDFTSNEKLAMLTSCGDVYHKECLQLVLLQNSIKYCPICKRGITQTPSVSKSSGDDSNSKSKITENSIVENRISPMKVNIIQFFQDGPQNNQKTNGFADFNSYGCHSNEICPNVKPIKRKFPSDNILLQKDFCIEPSRNKSDCLLANSDKQNYILNQAKKDSNKIESIAFECEGDVIIKPYDFDKQKKDNGIFEQQNKAFEQKIDANDKELNDLVEMNKKLERELELLYEKKNQQTVCLQRNKAIISKQNTGYCKDSLNVECEKVNHIGSSADFE